VLSQKFATAWFLGSFLLFSYPNILNPIYTSHLLAFENGMIDCSETLAFKLQTPGNQPEESVKHSERSESLIIN
jgi:hypothetical protein